MSDGPRLILASASPRRRELLASLGISFESRPVEIDESPGAGEPPRDHVLRLARLKARHRASPGELVLGADTVVVLGGRLLGKPRHDEEARQMLGTLAGREHTVWTGVALHAAERQLTLSEAVCSRVRIAAMSASEIAWYVATGEPADKAGAYAIQGLGALFVEAIHGNYTNVVGLPLPLIYRLFRDAGHDLLAFRAEPSLSSRR